MHSPRVVVCPVAEIKRTHLVAANLAASLGDVRNPLTFEINKPESLVTTCR